MNPSAVLLNASSSDAALSEALGSRQPYVLGVFGGLGTLATERVFDALLANSDGSGHQGVLVRGGLAPTRTLRARLVSELERRGCAVDPDGSWSDLVRAAARTPHFVVVADHAHLIEEADRKFLAQVAHGAKTAAGDGHIPRVVLISDDRRFLDRLNGSDSPFYDPLAALTGAGERLITVVGANLLPYGALAHLCTRWSAVDVVRGSAVFGGRPEVLRQIEPGRSLEWNVTRLLLDPKSGLFDYLPNAILARFQKTGRYGAVLSALANGARTWPEVVKRTPEFGSGSQMGAYMRRLTERGLVRVDSPLEASAGSRRRRYTLADSFDAFWFRFVAPLADRLRVRSLDPVDAWESNVAPRLDSFVAQVLAETARQYVGRYASRRLGSEARVVGGLWGENHDFDLAATLRDGSVVYGHCTWVDRGVGLGALQRARQQLRETRFGFGRERRTVLLIMRHPPSSDLEHAALRDQNVEWVDAERLVSAARTAGTRA